ncbi:MAG: ABC transporter permease [Candidatus Bathyarchaeia archaeon]
MAHENSKHKLRIPKIILCNLILVVVVIVLWETLAFSLHSRFFPSFSDVIKAFFTLITVGDVEGYTLLTHSAVSILRVLAGFLLAFVCGFPLGLAMGLKPLIYNASKSIVEPLRFIPPIAWIPLAIILLSGYTRYIFIIWLGAFFPILLNTIVAVKRTSPVLIDLAKSFGAKKGMIISKVVVPSSLPEVVAGMRIGLGVGWMCIVAAEMIGGETIGLGRLILKAAELLRIDVIIAGMITIGLIGLLMNEIFLFAEKRLFKWRQEVKL